MPATTQDIFFLTVSLSIAVITIFMCWSLYYALTSLHDIRVVFKSIRKKFDAIVNYAEKVKEKTESTATTATTVGKAIIEVVEYLKERKGKKKTKKKKG